MALREAEVDVEASGVVADPPAEDNANYLTSRSGRLWSKTPVHRRGPQDMIRHHPEITRDGNVTSPLEAFHLFITPVMTNIMTIETSREAQRVISLWNLAHPEKVKQWNPITSFIHSFWRFL